LRDVFRHTEDHDFLRLRIGIGHPGAKDLVTPYVLSRPRQEELVLINHSLSIAQRVMGEVMSGKLVVAQTELHTVTDGE
jgi:PTH1 family peptidyl-tRNA hydrolase